MSTSNPDRASQDTPAESTGGSGAIGSTRRPASGGQEKTTTTVSPKKHGPPKPVWIILAVVIAAVVFYFVWNSLQKTDKNKEHVSGRIEGYETNVGAKIAGKVEWIKYREGALVKKGELIVHLSDEDIQAQLRGAKARQQKAMAEREQADEQLDVVRAQIKESVLNQAQSVEDAQGRILQAEANVAAAQANRSEAEAQASQAQADWELAALRKTRYQKLAQRGAVAQDDADQAVTNEASSRATVSARKAAVDSARKQLISAEGALTQARTNRFNPGIRTQQLKANEVQLHRAQAALQSANQDIANAKADVEQIAANIVYLNIDSPISGVVTARPVEPGAVVAAGQTVLSLINLDTVYLRAYIPEGRAGRVRVGQKTQVFLDSNPKQPLSGHVIEVDPEASFTPENIYFKEDRVKQVFGMKIGIDNPGGFAKPGMPADADILVDSQ